MKVIERRVVEQEWYKSALTSTGWDNFGWVFKDSGSNAEVSGWEIVDYLRIDKFGNAWLGIAEKETEI